MQKKKNMYHIDFFHHWSGSLPQTAELLSPLTRPHQQQRQHGGFDFSGRTSKISSELPSQEQLTARTVEGLPLTQAEAKAIAATESDITGRRPIKDGPAATAQSLHDRQQRQGGRDRAQAGR